MILFTIQNLDDANYLDIDQVILEAYKASIELIENLEITALLKKHQAYELEKLSQFMFRQLNSKSKVSDNLTGIIDYDDDMRSDSESDDGEYENNDDEESDNNSSDEDGISDNDGDGEGIQPVKTIFSGIRIKGKINADSANSCFRVKINDAAKFLYKQSTVWLLTNKNDRSSMDRLPRVLKSNKTG